MIANRLCKLFGHKWEPVFIKGTYNNREILFIACECERCGKGSKGVNDIHYTAKNRKIGCWNEAIFDREFEKEDHIITYEDLTDNSTYIELDIIDS